METQLKYFGSLKSPTVALLLSSLIWIATVNLSTAQITIDEMQLQAYMALVKADGAKDEGHVNSALTNYQEALANYKTLKAEAPDFKPDIIDYRISYCANQINDLSQRSTTATGAPALTGNQGSSNQVYAEQVEHLQNQVDELEQKLNAAQNEAAPKGRREKKLEEEVNALRAEQKSLSQKLKEASRNVEAARNEAQKELNQRLYESEAAHRASENEIVALQKELERLKATTEKQSKQTTKKLSAQAQQELERVKMDAAHKAESMQTALAESNKEMLGLKEQIQRMSDTLQELESESSKTIELEASLDRAVVKINTLEEERQVMESALNIAQNSKTIGRTKVKELQDQYTQSLADKDAANKRVDELERFTSDARENHRVLQEELLQLKAQKGHQEGTKIQLDAQLREYQIALEQAQRSLSENQNILQKNMQEKEQLNQRLREVEIQNQTEVSKEVKALQEQVASLKEKHKRAEEHISKLNKDSELQSGASKQVLDAKLQAEKEALESKRLTQDAQEQLEQVQAKYQSITEQLEALDDSYHGATAQAKNDVKRIAAQEKQIKELVRGLEKAKMTHTQLKKAAETKQDSMDQAERASVEASQLAEQHSLNILEIERKKLTEQIEKTKILANEKLNLASEVELANAVNVALKTTSAKLGLGLDKAFEANNKLQAAVNSFKVENAQIPNLKSTVAENLIEKDQLKIEHDRLKDKYEAIAARIDESEAKEKFMRINAEETISQLETLELQHNKVLGQLNSLRDQNQRYQKEATASTQETAAIKKAIDELQNDSLIPMKAKIETLEREKTQLSSMIKETKSLAESHQKSAAALIQKNDNSLRHAKIEIQSLEQTGKKLKDQVAEQSVALATAGSLQKAHDARQVQLKTAMTQIEEYRNLATELQEQAATQGQALRSQNELLSQIDEMDATLIRLREEAAMVPGLANAQRIAEASVMALGAQVENLEGQILERDQALLHYQDIDLQLENLSASKDAALAHMESRNEKVHMLEARLEELQSSSNAATKESAYLSLKLSEARSEIQKLSRQQLDLIRQIRTLLGGAETDEQ